MWTKAKIVLLSFVALLMGGCGVTHSWYEFYRLKLVVSTPYYSRTYIQELNFQSRLRHSTKPARRSMVFYGKLTEVKKEAGIKFVFPF